MKPSESPYPNLSYKQRQLPIEMQELIENARKEKGGLYYINYEGKEVFCATGDRNYSSAVISATKYLTPDGKIILIDDEL